MGLSAKENDVRQVGGTDGLDMGFSYGGPVWLWLIVPLLVLALQPIGRIIGEPFLSTYVISEKGLTENITVVSLIIGAGFAIHMLAANRPDRPWLTAWIVAFALGSLFWAGEELSWGQHYFGWETSKEWIEINAVQETNLHNLKEMGWLLNRGPRLVLSVFAFIGCIYYPLRRRRRGDWPLPGSWRYLFWPTVACVPAALFAIGTRLIDRIRVWFDISLPEPIDYTTRQFEEIQEVFLALAVMLYLIAMHRRARQAGAGETRTIG